MNLTRTPHHFIHLPGRDSHFRLPGRPPQSSSYSYEAVFHHPNPQHRPEFFPRAAFMSWGWISFCRSRITPVTRLSSRYFHGL